MALPKLKSMSPQQLLKLIEKLPISAPITELLEVQMKANGNWKPDTQWYTSQKEHWLGWLSQYHTEGFYGRDISKKRSAEFAYNYIACPPMVLWLGEAAGVETNRIQAAKEAALNCRQVFHSQCAAIRKEVPWRIVEKALINAESGKYITKNEKKNLIQKQILMSPK